ncbi:MAG: TIGR03790 family protein [Deltaproteobacteria bacterium]|nr:TIGR03790 family protein [Deltaproteobacteria bacterium]MBW2723280.1 TIGR03790 family protein [Deltaproteobacteria bacterium]
MITNSESPISLAIGEYYAAARNVPSRNVVQLKIPLRDPTLASPAHETISAEQYDEWIRQPLEQLIDERGIRESIEILVTTKGVPLRVDGEKSSAEDWLRVTSQAAVDAELSLLFSDAAGSAGIPESINPFFDARGSFREFRRANPDASLRYMVARLTGYANEIDSGTRVPTDIKQLIDAATGYTDGADNPIWLIDEDPSRDPGLSIANQIWLGPTAEILSAMGLKVQYDREPEFVSDVEGIAGYSSWGSNDGHDAGDPYYGEIRGKRYPGVFAPRSLASDFVSTNGRSFTFPPQYGQSLIADLVHLGVAGVTGHVYEPALSGVPRPQILLPSYASGVRAVEAFYRSIPYLGWMNLYVGDPLMTVAEPLARPRGDRDRDGISDATDNCIEVPNPKQRDTNADGFGNMCDADVDGDGLVTTSWGVAYPLTKRGDVEWIAMSSQNGPYDPNFDLDGDGDIDGDDLSIAHMSLFMPPGPSGQAVSPGRN